MSEFCCPVCGKPLHDEGKSLYCQKRHCFDKAKSGYVNLLPANQAHSKAPGDNKLMTDSRTAFLNRGYYEPLRQAVCDAAVRAASNTTHPTILDAGCGEGYYTVGVAEALERAGLTAELYGVDISKFALNNAARRTKSVRFAVGSVFRLPLADESCDWILEAFAPFCREEFLRVLKPGGRMLLVIPGRDHLLELKRAVYEHPYENEPKPYALEGFTWERREEVRDAVLLESADDIRSLFAMTPYFYKTSPADTRRLLALNQLETTISFELLHYQKQSALSIKPIRERKD